MKKKTNVTKRLKKFLVHIENIKANFNSWQIDMRYRQSNNDRSFEDLFAEIYSMATSSLNYPGGIRNMSGFYEIPRYTELARTCLSALSKDNKRDFEQAIDVFAGACCQAFILNSKGEK